MHYDDLYFDEDNPYAGMNPEEALEDLKQFSTNVDKLLAQMDKHGATNMAELFAAQAKSDRDGGDQQ
ncbi:hypothetical protein [Gulosibacter bifidus]|uniref:Uncharacterized protein n=1 Tax=Gulosibacter bifidus TaxID=272239 RepID=A0ABW5RI81_9MICO|nr:hypothetical protein [Gulosibacter bifidus]